LQIAAEAIHSCELPMPLLEVATAREMNASFNCVRPLQGLVIPGDRRLGYTAKIRGRGAKVDLAAGSSWYRLIRLHAKGIKLTPLLATELLSPPFSYFFLSYY